MSVKQPEDTVTTADAEWHTLLAESESIRDRDPLRLATDLAIWRLAFVTGYHRALDDAGLLEADDSGAKKTRQE